MIEFSDVSVCYNPEGSVPTHALREVSLKFASGEWAFLVGPSGAGKSTLIKMVYAGVAASRGRIFVEGQDITQIKPREVPKLRRTIGVIFQDFQLLPQKTVWENVAFALQVIGTPQKNLVREVPRALDIVGLAMKQDKLPHELSGGEAQRVAIARAIVNHPQLLLADEPTGNLDPDTAWDIVQVLKAVNESGTTVLMATHDRGLVDALGKRVVRLKDGRVFSDENPGRYHAEDGDLRAPDFAAGFGAGLAAHDALSDLEGPEDNLPGVPASMSVTSSPLPVSSALTASVPPPSVASRTVVPRAPHLPGTSPVNAASGTQYDASVPGDGVLADTASLTNDPVSSAIFESEVSTPSTLPRRIPVMLPPPVPSPHGPRPDPAPLPPMTTSVTPLGATSERVGAAREYSASTTERSIAGDDPHLASAAPDEPVAHPINRAPLGSPENPIVSYEE